MLVLWIAAPLLAILFGINIYRISNKRFPNDDFRIKRSQRTGIAMLIYGLVLGIISGLAIAEILEIVFASYSYLGASVVFSVVNTFIINKKVKQV